MIMSLVLFENEFLNIVSISFTALVLNELIMVALEITTWYNLSHFLLSRLLTMVRQAYLYGCIRDSHTTLLYYQHRFLARVLWYVMDKDFGCVVAHYPSTDLSFVLSVRFVWKVAVIVAVSALPLYIIKMIRRRVAPAASSKLL